MAAMHTGQVTIDTVGGGKAIQIKQAGNSGHCTLSDSGSGWREPGSETESGY